MTVYVITKGDYSDYHICAVSTDKKKAEVLRKAFDDKDGWREARIETYETNQFLTEIESGMKLFECAMKDDVEMSVSTYMSDLDYIDDLCFRVREYSKGYMAPGYGVYVWAKDSDHARKIAADKIAEYKARKARVV